MPRPLAVYPFASRAPRPGGPGPEPHAIHEYSFVFDLGGTLYQFDGFRWALSDCDRVGMPTVVDPLVPGTAVTVRMTNSSSGVVSYPLPADEVRRLAEAWGPPSPGS